MNLSIKFARPNLIQNSPYSFSVNTWIVKGKILVPDDECKCNEKDFDTYIDTDKLVLSESDLKELVIKKLGK